MVSENGWSLRKTQTIIHFIAFKIYSDFGFANQYYPILKIKKKIIVAKSFKILAKQSKSMPKTHF